MDETESLFRRLGELTDRVGARAGEGDLPGLEKTLTERGRVVARLAEIGAAGGLRAYRPLARAAVRHDTQARRAVEELCRAKQREIRQSNRSYRPLLRYNRSRFDFSAGMVLDQKK